MDSIVDLLRRYRCLYGREKSIVYASEILIETYKNNGIVFTCGNGGSAADADHIVGELMKGFLKKRTISEDEQKIIGTVTEGMDLANTLQGGLPAISLHSQSALLTAFMNDVDPDAVYAQVLYTLGRENDTLIAISTSGNSRNVVNAARIAKYKGMRVISLVGDRICALDKWSDCAVHAPDTETYRVQELHLPIYHWLCARVEDEFFSK